MAVESEGADPAGLPVVAQPFPVVVQVKFRTGSAFAIRSPARIPPGWASAGACSRCRELAGESEPGHRPGALARSGLVDPISYAAFPPESAGCLLDA